MRIIIGLPSAGTAGNGRRPEELLLCQYQDGECVRLWKGNSDQKAGPMPDGSN